MTVMPPASVEEILARLTQLEHGRQALVDTLWSTIPSIIVENSYGAAVALVGGAATLTVNPSTTQLVMITNVIATMPSGATGVIQLGDVTIPLGAGLTNLSTSLLLTQRATRALVSDTAGPMALVLMGHVLPTFGALT